LRYFTKTLFQFDFQNPDAVFKIIPENMPDGFICIRIWIEALPWLLDEECDTKMYYPPKWWQISKPYFYNKKNPPPPYDNDAIEVIKVKGAAGSFDLPAALT